MNYLSSWLGGKVRLAARLIALFPSHACYVEPFGGMATVLLNKEPSKGEVYNDLDGRLVALFNVIKHHGEAFDLELAVLLKARQTFEEFRDQPGFTDIQRAARFLYCQQFGYSCDRRQFGTSRKSPSGGGGTIDGLRRRAVAIRDRLKHVVVEWLDWEACIGKYDGPETFFYCDPPYDDSVGYDVEFLDRDQDQLARVLRSIKGRFLMTNKDTRRMRALYRGYAMTTMHTSLAADRAHTKTLRNLVVRNY